MHRVVPPQVQDPAFALVSSLFFKIVLLRGGLAHLLF